MLKVSGGRRIFA